MISASHGEKPHSNSTNEGERSGNWIKGCRTSHDVEVWSRSLSMTRGESSLDERIPADPRVHSRLTATLIALIIRCRFVLRLFNIHGEKIVDRLG